MDNYKFDFAKSGYELGTFVMPSEDMGDDEE